MKDFEAYKVDLFYKKYVSEKYNIPITDILLSDKEYKNIDRMYFFFYQGKKYVEKIKMADNNRHDYETMVYIEQYVLDQTGKALEGEAAWEYTRKLSNIIWEFLSNDINNFGDLFNKKLEETDEFFIFEYLDDWRVPSNIDEITDLHFRILREKMKHYKNNRIFNLMPSMELDNWMISDTDIKYVDLDSFIICDATSCFFKQLKKYYPKINLNP